MFRFLGFVWTFGNETQRETVCHLACHLQSGSGWENVLHVDGMTVFCKGASRSSRPYPLAGSGGVVLGTLFERSHDSSASIRSYQATLTPLASASILNSAGRRLINDYWGRYVAFLTDPNDKQRKLVIKDPVDNLQCFYFRFRGVTIFFSCMADCLKLGLPPFTLNWEYLRRYVGAGLHFTEGTALSGVVQLHGGECLVLRDGTISSSFYWHPGSVLEGLAIEEPAVAAQGLKSIVKLATNSWAACYDSILHRLSGGLDSSIVLACLNEPTNRPRITCITYYLPNGNSDERPLARLAAKRAGCEQVERARDARGDLKDILDLSPSVNPPPDIAFTETSRFERRLAQQMNATAVFNGDGGDFLFGGCSAEFAATDFLLRQGFGPGLLRCASDVALLTDVSIWKVLRDSTRDRLTRNDRRFAVELAGHYKLVQSDICQALAHEGTFTHPWFRMQTKIPHSLEVPFLALSRPSSFYDPSADPDEAAPEPVRPLICQPVVEYCLRIPTYVHISGARQRGLARRAFASDVPHDILARQWKDRAAGVCEESLVANLSFLRERLLDGVLVKERILNRQRLEDALSGRPAKSVGYADEVFVHLATELWLQSWTSVPQRVAA